MTAVLDNLPLLLSGFGTSLALILVSSVIALALGVVLAGMRVSPVPLLQRVATGYVECLRTVPTAVVFFFALFALPQMGVRIGFFPAAVVALAVYYAAFFCEAVRSVINAVPPGQAEAARSIGLEFGGSLRFVVLPQALRSVIPPLLNVFVALTKSSAIASAFGVAELLASTTALATVESDAVIPILLACSVFYLIITIPAGLAAERLEKKVAVAR
ncbi:glutamate permease [Pseudonocardia sp. Ae406_Ps2]|uniref:amino acid ABC transporter permease n=1 Tax=unclassified Pseudonocardia TaxID=2619320 RepID=UPI00094B47BB|nr:MULTISPECIES: amino acid ABC transporter permease [unclassified Pseudonocardia]OLL96366.1 glutamate permease [Pseudonocardia sp. Ae331_Ps2]OLM05924.1 glutamate permease [Pseudonocardia sp. Ae406_Ps2]OLM27502.1 glutamate permease [Pseudonocardia sp. Ae706_Ps2]